MSEYLAFSARTMFSILSQTYLASLFASKQSSTVTAFVLSRSVNRSLGTLFLLWEISLFAESRIGFVER